MKLLAPILGAICGLLVLSAATPANADAATVIPVSPDTLTAIAQLFPAGTSLLRIEEMLGQPDAVSHDSITYRGVYFEISRDQTPNVPVRIIRGDTYPGSAIVVFSSHRAPKITGVPAK